MRACAEGERVEAARMVCRDEILSWREIPAPSQPEPEFSVKYRLKRCEGWRAREGKATVMEEQATLAGGRCKAWQSPGIDRDGYRAVLLAGGS